MASYNTSTTITKTDGAVLSSTPRAIYVGTSGDINCQLLKDTANTLFKSVPVGQFDIRPKIIHATGTTANNLIALS